MKILNICDWLFHKKQRFLQWKRLFFNTYKNGRVDFGIVKLRFIIL